ncbi:protein translocase SEC61 complex subunit gamma [Candidatus Woesearchaeota archaeon]|nr:protein translocase SEC61 complex subunit gamma [Candidatus Woesearchaeota archaeon]
MPKIKPSEWPNKISLKLKEYRRVLKITKKPSSEEFKAIVKASGLGIIIIGFIGFIIHMITQALQLL